MDQRVRIEVLPGAAFLAGNALGGIFVGARLATLATALVLVLRWHWDKSQPWLAP